MKVCKSFHFDAAHFLPDYPGECASLHGHRWILEVEIVGPIDPKTGFVMDFTLLKSLIQSRIISKLDHKSLNVAFPNPTAEIITLWVRNELQDTIRSLGLTLSRLRLYETPDSWVELDVEVDTLD